MAEHQEAVIVQVLIRGEGAGVAAAWLAQQFKQMKWDGMLLPARIELEQGEIDCSNMTTEISTRAPRPEEV